MNLAATLDAGKYAAFIWPAYGVTALGFAWMIVDTLARARRWRRAVESHQNILPPLYGEGGPEGRVGKSGSSPALATDPHFPTLTTSSSVPPHEGEGGAS